MGHDRGAHLMGEAICFSMHGTGGPLDVVIDGGALQRYFGADADPQSWLPAYIANFRVIHALAQLTGCPTGRVLLRSEDISEAHIKQLRSENPGG